MQRWGMGPKRVGQFGTTLGPMDQEISEAEFGCEVEQGSAPVAIEKGLKRMAARAQTAAPVPVEKNPKHPAAHAETPAPVPVEKGLKPPAARAQSGALRIGFRSRHCSPPPLMPPYVRKGRP
jgi:hypothetical protein